MQPLRIGLRGCGLVPLRVHLPNRRRIPGVTIAAAFDVDPLRLERVQAIAPGVAVFTDETAFLASGLDAVIVSIPYEGHATAAQSAFAAGKHVYVEKPFATGIDDAIRMVDAQAQSGRTGFVGFNYRFNPLIVALRAKIASGQIGNPISLRTTFSFAPHENVDWNLSRHGEWGALFDAAPHHLDLSRFLLGSEATHVTAELVDASAPRDTAHIQLRMADGVLVHNCLQLSSIEEHRIEVYGSSGKLSVDVLRSLAVEFTPTKVTRFGPLAAKAGQLLQPLTHQRYLREKLAEPWNEPSFRHAVVAFARAAAGQSATDQYPDFADGLASQVLLEAAERSVATGQRIEVGV